MDGALAEVVRVGFHGKAVNANDDFFLLFLLACRVVLAVAVSACNFKYSVGYEVLSGAVALDYSFYQVFRYFLVVCQQLLGVLWQAVAAVAESRVNV